MCEVALRGLLKQGWQLVAAPVGEFEPEEVPRARVALTDGQVTVEAGGETVYQGPLVLNADPLGTVWPELARAAGEVLLLVTVGSTPILTEEDTNRVARDGHLLGLAGTPIVDVAAQTGVPR